MAAVLRGPDLVEDVTVRGLEPPDQRDTVDTNRRESECSMLRLEAATLRWYWGKKAFSRAKRTEASRQANGGHTG